MKYKTFAAVLENQNAPLKIKELEIPKLNEGQVLIEIAYSGVCQTQLNELRGYKGPDQFLPHTLGHEGSGIVLEIGQNVTKVKPGDKVVLSWIKGVGFDIKNSHYLSEGKVVQSGPISTFQKIAIISENRVIPIPCNMPLKEAALLGCAIPTGAGIVLNEMNVQSHDSVAIFGIGGIGLSALLAAKYKNASTIIAIDVHDFKLDKAKKLGATHTINAKKENVIEEILKITKGQGVNYCIESAGVKEVMETAFKCIKNQTGLCILAGNIPKGQYIQIDPFDLINGKRIRGTWGGASSIDKDISFYCDLFLKGNLSLNHLISDEFSLNEINTFLSKLEAGTVSRGLICF